MALLTHPRDLVEQQARRLQPQLHVHDAVRDGLELADRFPELLALRRIRDRGFELVLHRADLAGEDAAAFQLQAALRDADTGLLGSEPVPFRHKTVLEDEIAHRHRAQSHLVAVRRNAEALGVAVDDECSDAPFAECGIDGCQNQRDVGDRAEGDESLLPQC